MHISFNVVICTIYQLWFEFYRKEVRWGEEKVVYFRSLWFCCESSSLTQIVIFL